MRQRLISRISLIAVLPVLASGLVVGETHPGADEYPDALRQRLAAALGTKGEAYEPRTRHLGSNGEPRFTNRLILETSPYLQQHAHNPVNWYPWGDEAFADARRLGRPVLLSIGYSTCHWCHVMEELSFENEEIATYINANYIAIKVDREERPDLDAIYMSAVRSLSGRGGWPMTSWLTPDGEPFYGGTYYAPRGFLQLLQRLKQQYDDAPDEIVRKAAETVRQVQHNLTVRAGQGLPEISISDRAVENYRSRFDETHGGLTGQRKFPSTLPIRLLLRQHLRQADSPGLAMATQTLDHMAAGGIHDHVGGGFHRYTTTPD